MSLPFSCSKCLFLPSPPKFSYEPNKAFDFSYIIQPIHLATNNLCAPEPERNKLGACFFLHLFMASKISAASSSSMVKSSNSKPLNPLALSYQPQSMPPIAEPHYPQDKIYLPHQFFIKSLNLYEAPLLIQQVSELQQGVFLLPLVLPDYCPYPCFGYCSSGSWDYKGGYSNLYNAEKQPHPSDKVFNGPKSIPYNGISYWSERIVEKKKNAKWGFIPPRLKSPREYPMHSQKIWVKNADVEKIKTCSDVALLSPVTDEEQTKLEGKSSVIIKNVPNHFRRDDLQRILDYHCRTENRKAQSGCNFCKSAYDFLYLPMDFGFHLNLGFAFVNFTSPVAALRFYRAFNNVEWSCEDRRKKICEIGTAKFQGKDALEEQFRRSSFPCHTNEYLPVVFSPPRDGFNRSRRTLVGRRTYVTAAPKDENVMIMTKRKKKKV